MLIALPHKIKTIGTILSATGLLLGFIWTYLEKVIPISSKQELSTIYLIQIISSAIIIIVALLSLVILLAWHIWISPKAIAPVDLNKYKSSERQTPEEQFTYKILFHILQIKSFNQLATPRTLASAIDSEPETILDRLNNLHNEQYVTYQSGGKTPTVDTDFFLSPKAFEIINISPSQAKPKKPPSRLRKSWVRDW
jgi:hypothetical protein